MNVNMMCLRGKTQNNNIAIWMLILYVYILAIFTRNVLTQGMENKYISEREKNVKILFTNEIRKHT